MLTLRIFGKTIAGRVAVSTGDLLQPSRKTCHSDPDLSYTTVAARTDVYKYSVFSQEQYVIGTP